MKKILVFILLIILSVTVASTFVIWNIALKGNTPGKNVTLYVYPGTSGNVLSEQLDSANAILDPLWFKVASRAFKLNDKVKAGRYLGLQSPHNLILSGNIRSMEKLASIISGKISSDSAKILQTLKDKTLIDSLGFDKYSFPGMFLLNTYEIYWTSSPKEIVLRLHSEYNKFWNQERQQKARDLNLSPIEVVTLASIVAEESNIKSEHPVIAGVYVNRLKRGIPLQADPTIKYALNDPSIKRILYQHLEIDSPYNTYKIKGLPPGPITIPSPSVIDAVLDYSKHNYLYFCAKPSLDGSHNFASTLSAHNRNARAYQSAISKLK
jgi:UPF0755 protein